MKQKELCMMCNEYSVEDKCEHKKDCALLNILKENEQLKRENREMKKKIEEFEVRRRWELFPDAMGK